MEATFVLERHEWAYSRKIAACDAPRSNLSPDHSSDAHLRLFIQKNARKFMIHILYIIEKAQRVYSSQIKSLLCTYILPLSVMTLYDGAMSAMPTPHEYRLTTPQCHECSNAVMNCPCTSYALTILLGSSIPWFLRP
jgi:hypothetical protein